jgi:hypothetical protein
VIAIEARSFITYGRQNGASFPIVNLFERSYLFDRTAVVLLNKLMGTTRAKTPIRAAQSPVVME